MEALTKIEIEFARLRDKLYIERMADVEKDRIGVETGPSFSTSPKPGRLTRTAQERTRSCCTSHG